jgi:hypothetical protein
VKSVRSACGSHVHGMFMSWYDKGHGNGNRNRRAREKSLVILLLIL